ncbi:Gem-associated 2 [Melia azedarach]|uniref:Gem-associated 2 n=1 Tax=Melia azedarach TaxID=155640 RepID=A0ACC1YJF7_MELAZ|nr:Gem-associated 2 [Melia azedarach]
MADDSMDSDTCAGFKRRITEKQQQEEEEHTSIPVSTVSGQDFKESSGIVFSTPRQENTGSTETSFKKVSSSCGQDKFEIGNDLSEGKKEVSCACFLEESQEKLDSVSKKITACDFVSDGKSVEYDAEVKGETVNYENLNGAEKGLLCGLVDKEDKDLMKVEMGFSGSQECDKFKKDEESIVEGDCKERKATSSVDVMDGFPVDEEMKFETLLDAEKKRLLAAVELGKVFEDKTHEEKVTGHMSFSQIDDMRSDLRDVDGETIDGIKLIDGSVRRSVKIEVIDDTALIESVMVPKVGNGCLKNTGVSGTAKMMQRNKEEKKQEGDGKKAKRARRKAKDMKMFSGMSARLNDVKHFVEDQDGVLNNGEHAKIMYSREEMEALRFVNIVEQGKMWRDIYTGLEPAVLKDYNNLARSKHQKQILMNADPRLCFSRKSEAPGIIGQEYSENMENEAEYMADYETENLNTMDSAFSHSTEGEANMVPEAECSEDYESDNDYASIQRPAFLVEGEPNFDSGPPEDGLEYLRRVRWEAAQIPKVKVAKPVREKFNKEQTVYMPQIPDIAECPEHLLPLKQWEDLFLADFSELRKVLSCHDYSSAAGKLQSMLINDIRTVEVHSAGFGPKCSIDESSIPNAEDGEISPSHQNPKMFLSNDHGDCPILSAILRMDSVTRASTLRKRISSVESLSTWSRNDSLWLFALCAAVDTPLDADTCAALRTLLRKCASLRAAKSELDDEVIMLNILATISGKFFGQSER